MNNEFIIKPQKPKTAAEPPAEENEEPLSEDQALEESGNEAIDIDMSVEDEASDDEAKADSKKEKKPKKKRRSPKAWFNDLSKKQKIAFIAGVTVALTGIGLGIYFALTGKTPVVQTKQTVATKKKPTTVASRLTGLQIKPELNKRGVTGVMVENSEFAWPQSGIIDAGVVFEAQAEGGITRFLVLFQESQPTLIGPVRSVRPYYADWLASYDAPLAHVGGSEQGLARLRENGEISLDRGAYPDSYQERSDKEPPHHIYTSATALDALKAKKGRTESTFTGFARKKEQPAKTPTAKTIDMGVSTGIYRPHYDYDTKTNSYKRSQNGAPHVDEKSGKQLSPKVVIALVIPRGSSGKYSTYDTVGSGAVRVFQDGTVTEGTWERASLKDQITFKDSRGNDLKLNPGQTWLCPVDSAIAAAYTP